jgi:type I restriction enzyme M protein
VIEALGRGILEISNDRVTYNLASKKNYDWRDPEEWVRARLIAWLIIQKAYPAARMDTEVRVPRRTPSDFADVAIYRDDDCREPYLVVETKRFGQSDHERRQWTEQLFGNANSLRAPLALYDDEETSILFNVADFPSLERERNRLGNRDAVPEQYGETPTYVYIAGGATDIAPMPALALEARVRRAHSSIWAGGRRDPLTAFDEWSKLLFAKVIDERTTPTGEPRRFQVGTNETTTAVANRIHDLFQQACRRDPSIFPEGVKIQLPDNKIVDVVSTLQDISLIRTDVDTIGKAFEHFFGSIFRGELGQYFTMRQLARFTVAALNPSHVDYVLDPTAGSGGFLLETLLQVWQRIDRDFTGQSEAEIDRLKTDFAFQHVFGIEIHEVLGRICKINLLIHHDGHTNIEASRSCLDNTFTNPRLIPPRAKFTLIVGNPPFGDQVKEGDDDHLGSNRLSNFRIAAGRNKAESEHVILERSVELLEPGGRLGLVVPDGLLNNQGEQSNCPQMRMQLTSAGHITAIISLPDYAFRKSGAQNKTSLIFFRKFTAAEKAAFDAAFTEASAGTQDEGDAIDAAYLTGQLDRYVFLAEAERVGYTPAGTDSPLNDLYKNDANGHLAGDQSNTILGEFRKFLNDPTTYQGITEPDCMAVKFSVLYQSHPSRRLDPKYHIFKREAARPVPYGWIRMPIAQVMRRREESLDRTLDPDRLYTVMTLSQRGTIRPREAGKGNNPPEWRGTYFADSSGTWYAAQAGDLVFSSIDLWKGCIAVVPDDFQGALVTKEFPIYEITDHRIDPEFLSCLLRSRYYQRAFRAITTGHSNRRRTQVADFEGLEIEFPPDPAVQRELISGIVNARRQETDAIANLKHELGNLCTS